MNDLLFPAALAAPPLVLAALLALRGRVNPVGALWLAPLPALALAVFGGQDAVSEVLGVRLFLDSGGRMLLTAACTLWLLAGAAAPAFFRDRRAGMGFAACWLLALTGSVGVFLTDEWLAFLVFYALVSLPAYGLVVADGTANALRAGRLYLGFALLGESVLLPGFVLLGLGREASEPLVFALLTLGFGIKVAILPLHFWLPPSHVAAPIPASAVLSGIIVKAGLIGMLRFLPFGAPLAAWGEAITALGFAGALFGVALGLTQRHPKTVLAYSSISQMGFITAILGLGISSGDTAVIPLVAFYAAHHVLAKGALFLAVGAAAGTCSRWMIGLPATLVGLGLAGLPLTGGSLAKLAVKAPLGEGIATTLASLSAAGTAMLMIHFVGRLPRPAAAEGVRPVRVLAAWLFAAAACLSLPWVFLGNAGLSPAEVTAPSSLWKTLLPVALGAAAALSLKPLLARLPQPAPGDILALGGGFVRMASAGAALLARANSWLLKWPVACCALLALTILLLAAFFLA